MNPIHPTLATVSDDGTHWRFRRNCAVGPGQLAGMLLALSAMSLTVAGVFWVMGVKLVLPFTVIELVALVAAFLVHARHVTDQECISLSSGRLVVEQELAGKTRRCEFFSHGVRIEPRLDGDRLVDVRGGGQVVCVGRFLRSDLRPLLAKEMRRALLMG